MDGHPLELLRRRFVVLASGQGPNEDIGESWAAAHVLGTMGVPNRVDEWGPEWPHDWQTWRAMLPHYLREVG
jgi:esterase/lipase superfamily enzyme